MKHFSTEAPNKDCVLYDPKTGETWFMFVASYKFLGAEFSIHFWAESDEQAHERISSIKQTLTYDGQLFGVIPVADFRRDNDE